MEASIWSGSGLMSTSNRSCEERKQDGIRNCIDGRCQSQAMCLFAVPNARDKGNRR